MPKYLMKVKTPGGEVVGHPYFDDVLITELPKDSTMGGWSTRQFLQRTRQMNTVLLRVGQWRSDGASEFHDVCVNLREAYSWKFIDLDEWGLGG